MTKTIIFEKVCGVSIDDFKDTIAVDRFIESRIGRRLAITGPGINDRTRESLDASMQKSFIALDAQCERLKGTEEQE